MDVYGRVDNDQGLLSACCAVFLRVDGYWCPFQGLTNVLEFPLSLTATLPAQMPNWDILSNLTTSLGKMKRSPIQVSMSCMHCWLGELVLLYSGGPINMVG